MIIIDKELPKSLIYSTNKIYAGINWRQRKKIKEDFLWWIKSIKINKQNTPLKDVSIAILFEFKSRPYDVDNCSFMGKMIIDSLVSEKIFEDDSPSHIKSITYISSKSKTNRIKLFTIDLNNIAFM